MLYFIKLKKPAFVSQEIFSEITSRKNQRIWTFYNDEIK